MRKCCHSGELSVGWTTCGWGAAISSRSKDFSDAPLKLVVPLRRLVLSPEQLVTNLHLTRTRTLLASFRRA
jgi:hypothetical protein